MKVEKLTVKQWHYEDFEEHIGVTEAIMTEWGNGEGVDIYIERKNLDNINISLHWDDLTLFRKLFSDFENK
jgi:hypothetical protein